MNIYFHLALMVSINEKLRETEPQMFHHLPHLQPDITAKSIERQLTFN